MMKEGVRLKKIYSLAVIFLLAACSSGVQQENEQKEETAYKEEIASIYALAEEGKVPGISAVAGGRKTGDMSGAAAKLTNNGWIYELQTEQPAGSFTQEQVEEVLGEAHTSLADAGQTTLVYEAGADYELQLLFPEDESSEIVNVAVVHKPTKKIAEQLKNMTLDEKAGQLMMMGIERSAIDDAAKKFIEERHVGSVILFKRNFASTAQSLQLINDVKSANAQNEVPLLIGVDEEGGRVTRLPDELKKLPPSRYVGSVNEGAFAYRAGQLLGRQVGAFGINMDFAPVLDVDSNPRNPVIGDRSFGSTPAIVSKAGLEQAKGMKEQQVIPVVKHFPGHGDTSVDSHVDLPVIAHSKERLAQIELKPFKDAIENGIEVVMVSHLLVQAYDRSLPASLSEAVIQGLLRDELGFEGVVVTDDLVMGAIEKNYSAGEAAVRVIQAGGDLLLVGHGYAPVDEMLNAVKEAAAGGEISETRLNESVERILRLKQSYGLTDESSQTVPVDELNAAAASLLEEMKAAQ